MSVKIPTIGPAPTVKNMTATSSQTILAMRRVSWLAATEPAVLEEMARQARMVPVRNKELVTRCGAPMPHLLIVATGQLEVSLTSPAGKRRVIGFLGPGQAFGLIPLMDQSSVIHDAAATEDGLVVRVPRQALLDAMQRSHLLTMGLVRQLCQRSRLLYESLADQSLLPLRGRVARTLLSLTNAYGLLPNDDVETNYRLRMSQADLCDVLGVSRQSLNAELKKMERAGLLKMAYSQIELLDMPALRHMLKIQSP
jgi:CRP/FNR family transcriptional regulator, cyclic AMP receptor protein